MTASVAHPCSSRAEVLAVLREHFPALAAEFKLSSLQLFGSFATDEATACSDVDLLASFAEPIGFGFIHLAERLEALLDQYARTLPADRRSLLQHFRFVDFARKVVGVGSVGTRCWMVLLQGPNGGPLFLQIKEANRAAPDLARANPSPSLHQGQRVVEGQQKLQAVGDVLLGWATDEETGVHYYVRQLWDSKKSVDIPALRASSFRVYVGTCAWALARAHARTGDPAAMSGYLGTSGAFPTAIAGFAMDYADQTVRDHARLVQAIADGRLPAA